MTQQNKAMSLLIAESQSCSCNERARGDEKHIKEIQIFRQNT